MNQMAVEIAKEVAERPRSCQGDIAAKPWPDPRANNTSDRPEATNAPAMIADQDAADLEMTAGWLATRPVPRGSSTDSMDGSLIQSGVRAHGQQQDDGDGNAHEPKQ